GQTASANGQIEAAISSDKDLGIDIASSSADMTVSANENGKQVVMRSGSAIFAPSVDTVVETPFGSVAIDAKSVALVVATDNALAVYNLDDAHHDAVTVTSAGRKLTLTPGRDVVVTNVAVRSFEMINPAEGILYRNVADAALNGGLKAFTGEFS